MCWRPAGKCSGKVQQNERTNSIENDIRSQQFRRYSLGHIPLGCGPWVRRFRRIVHDWSLKLSLLSGASKARFVLQTFRWFLQQA